MPNRAIPYIKLLVHVVCLLPLLQIILRFQSGALGLMADPVLWITHKTGSAALIVLLVSLAVTPVRRLHPRLSNLIRLRRLVGLYAFFYATLHLATYAFLFSGYDLPGAYAAVRAGHPGVLVNDWKLVWPTVLDDLKKRRFVQVGLVSWFLLFLLAVTSPTWVLRKMGGARWQTLHRMVYVAAVLAIVHYWWLVKAGNRAPLPMTLILAALLGARVLWIVMKRRRTARPRAVAAVG